jgi:hypothetical protein
MAAIVRSNRSLASGGIVLLRQTLDASDTGQATYSAEYCCLRSYASVWMPRFRSGTTPVTPIPQEILALPLTRQPTLIDVSTESANGLFYFNATYSAGIESDVVITTSTDVRNISWIAGYNGTQRITASFDYVSTSVRATATNTEVPIISGSVGLPFNVRNVLVNPLVLVSNDTIVQTSRTRNARGEYQNSVTSTGIYVAYDAPEPVDNSEAGGSSTTTPIAQVQVSRPVIGSASTTNRPNTILFPDRNAYDPTSLSGTTGRSPFSGYSGY